MKSILKTFPPGLASFAGSHMYSVVSTPSDAVIGNTLLGPILGRSWGWAMSGHWSGLNGAKKKRVT
jgi:hypothetical protein